MTPTLKPGTRCECNGCKGCEDDYREGAFRCTRDAVRMVLIDDDSISNPDGQVPMCEACASYHDGRHSQVARQPSAKRSSPGSTPGAASSVSERLRELAEEALNGNQVAGRLEALAVKVEAIAEDLRQYRDDEDNVTDLDGCADALAPWKGGTP